MNEKTESQEDIKCIPTWYNGVLHRSRTEARASILLDALGREHSYENEGFISGDTNYLPDFYLGKKVRVEIDSNLFSYVDDIYFEVKGMDSINPYEKRKMANFIKDGNVLYIFGSFPKGYSTKTIFENIKKKATEIPLVYGLFLSLKGCVAYPGRSKNGEFTFYINPDSPDMDEDWTYKAYSLALSAQFEHGAKPQIKLTENGPVNLQDLVEFEEDPESDLLNNLETSEPEVEGSIAEVCESEHTISSRSLNAAARGLMSKKDNRSHRISIFVTENRYQALQALKKATGVSVNSFINAGIDQLIEDNQEYLQSKVDS